MTTSIRCTIATWSKSRASVLLGLLLFAWLTLITTPAAAQDRPVPPEERRFIDSRAVALGHLEAKRHTQAVEAFESLEAFVREHDTLARHLPRTLSELIQASIGASAKATGLAAIDRLVAAQPALANDERLRRWRQELDAIPDPKPPPPPPPPQPPPRPTPEEIADQARADALVEEAARLTDPAQIDQAIALVERALVAAPHHAAAAELVVELARRRTRRDGQVQGLLEAAQMLAEAPATKDAALAQIDRALALDPTSAEARELRERIEARYTGATYTPGQTQKLVADEIVIELAWIPPGVFMMGGDQSPEEVMRLGLGATDVYHHEHPQHAVRISRGFWIMTTEVQQGQWQAVMGNNPSHFNAGPSHPVEQVSWYDAVEFANRLTEAVARRNPQAGLRPHYELRSVRREDGRIVEAEVRQVPGNRGFRLPTEAQWEYACRAGTTGPFHFGDTIDAARANYNATLTYGGGAQGEFRRRTAPVAWFGVRGRNAWGLQDMHGNVWEWCWDTYDGQWYEPGKWPTNAEGERVDPTGPRTESLRVVRGGSWLDYPRFVRSAYRNDATPSNRYASVGFRLALDSDASTGAEATERTAPARPAAAGLIGGQPWPERPRLEDLYWPQFGRWVGQRLDGQSLALQIDRPMPVNEGRWHLLFYRANCDSSHEMMRLHLVGELEPRVIAIRIPDTDPRSDLSMPLTQAIRRSLPSGPTFVFQTPVLLTVQDGVVQCVATDPEDAKAVRACLNLG